MPLADLGREIDQGEWVGNIEVVAQEELTGKEAADALYAAGSEPGFFQLDDDGRELNEV
jgi:hypothetical protein